MPTHNKNIAVIFIAFALVVFCSIETLCFTYFKILKAFEQWNNILYAVCGLAIGVLTMVLAAKPMATKTIATKYKWLQVFFALAFGIFLVVLCTILGNSMFNKVPISHYIADMLPSIKLACNRFVQGKDIYAHPINEPGMWPNTYIPYLPAMWMPYLPTTLLGVDIRWTNLVAIMAISVFMLYLVVRYNTSYQWIILPVSAILLFVLVKFYTWEDKTLLLWTQEATPALFYFLLFGALALNKQWLIAIALALCVLSRYSVAPFIPFYFLWLLVNKDYKGFTKTAVISGTIVIAVFILPYFIQRPMYFIGISKGYVNFEAAYWFNYLDGVSPLTTKLGIIQTIGYQPAILEELKNMMLGSIVIWGCIWLAYYYVRIKHIAINKELYALAGFKIALVLFYNLLNINYQYLYLVPTVISYPIIWAVFKKTDLSKHKTT